MNRVQNRFIFLVSWIFLIVSCSPHKTEAQISEKIIQDITVSESDQAIFLDLETGKSNLDEVLLAMSEYQYLDNQFSPNPVPLKYEEYSGYSFILSPKSSGAIDFRFSKDGILDSVHINHSGMSLEQIIKHLGPPNYFYLSQDDNPKGAFMMVNCIYLEKGIIVSGGGFKKSKERWLIEPDMVISQINIMPFDLTKSFFEERALSDSLEMEDLSVSVYEWKGYGNLLELFRQ